MTAESPQPIVKLISPHDNLAKPWKPDLIYKRAEGRFPNLDSEREVCAFDHIQQFLKAKVGGALPEAISESLSFPRLGWEFMDDKDARVFLFLGKDPELAGSTNLSNALGVVYVDMWPKYRDLATQDELSEPGFEAHELGVRGIVVDSTGQARALELSYRKNLRIFESRKFNVVNLAVSASRDEIRDEGEILGDNVDLVTFHRGTVDPSHFYHSGKLFTEAMWALTGTEKDDVHSQGVEFECWWASDNADSLYLIYDPSSSPREGFRINKRGKHDLALSFTPLNVYRKDPAPSWEIVLPKTLDYPK